MTTSVPPTNSASHVPASSANMSETSGEPVNAPSHTSMPSAQPYSVPRPGPRPGAHAVRTAVQAQAASSVDSSQRWGRVSEDGSVYLLLSDGTERLIGQWAAGSPDEALAHYQQRFSDLLLDIDLMSARLQRNPSEAEYVAQSATKLLASLPTAAVIGDLSTVENQLLSLRERAERVREEANEQRKNERETALARKTAILEELEDLALHSESWKATGERFTTALEEWRHIRGLDRTTDNKLWNRFKRIRDSFDHRRGAYFSALDKSRAHIKQEKELLIKQAEALQDSTEWVATGNAFRELMDHWRALGRGPKDSDERQWNRFNSARQHFFDARRADAAARDQEFENNAQTKDELIIRYSALIDPLLDGTPTEEALTKARGYLVELQEQWEDAGFVPRNQVREYSAKLGALENRVKAAVDKQWRRSDPATIERAQQFLDRVREYELQAEAADAAGNREKAAAAREQAALWREWAATAQHAVEEL